ncbi:MAG: sulfatase-like hydrolase/transferase [bacterium]|nr:sulfatase-like hydrolase/transferase [bacterium]
MITLDTTRADRLGCYGYEEDTTPFIDELANNATLFSNAFTTNPITLPAHTSILTGTYPLYHGVRDNSTFVVPEDIVTLAEVLSEQDWDTAAFVSSFVLDSRFNLDQGFSFYDDDVEASWSYDELANREKNAFGFAERKASQVVAEALEWLGHTRSQPFFVWLHFFDPHQPLNPPEPHRSQLASGYDAEIAFVDEQIGRLFADLKNRGEYDNTLIVIVGDHGEGLLDHEEPTHSLLIFDSTMQVPLIIRRPGQHDSRVVENVTSVIDVMPTILEILAIDRPNEIQGVSLVPLMNGIHEPADRPIYMESLVARLHFGWGELRGLRTAQEKLIHGPVSRLYRVDSDPGEVYDLATQEPESVQRLTAKLEQMIQSYLRLDAGTLAKTDNEARQKLQALGYIVSPVNTSRGITDTTDGIEAFDDPHAKRHIFDLHSVALENIRTGAYFEGIRQLEALIANDPKNAAAITDLATVYLTHGRQPAKARELYERSLAINPHQEEAHYFMARICSAIGNLEGSRHHCETILSFEPSSYGAMYELGRIYQAEGKDDLARDHFLHAYSADPSNLSAIMALATLHARRKDNDDAGRFFEEALAIDPGNPEVLYNIGVWYMQCGNSVEALANLRRVVSINPTDRDAHYVIGKLHYENGQLAEAKRSLLTAKSLGLIPERLERTERLLDAIDQAVE